MRRIVFCIILAVAFFLPSLFAAVHKVSGPEEKIQAVINVALDGDTVYLCDTITSEVNPPDSGSSGNVVTYKGNYAGHAANLTGTSYGFGF